MWAPRTGSGLGRAHASDDVAVRDSAPDLADVTAGTPALPGPDLQSARDDQPAHRRPPRRGAADGHPRAAGAAPPAPPPGGAGPGGGRTARRRPRGRRAGGPPLLVAVAVLVGRRVGHRDTAPSIRTLHAARVGGVADRRAGGLGATIAAVGRDRGLPERAVVIALATAQQESRLRNLDYGDRDSLGLFQQRPSQGWGTEAQVQDPVYAAGIVLRPAGPGARLGDRPAHRASPSPCSAAASRRPTQQHEAMAVELAAGLASGAVAELECGCGRSSTQPASRSTAAAIRSSVAVSARRTCRAPGGPVEAARRGDDAEPGQPVDRRPAVLVAGDPEVQPGLGVVDPQPRRPAPRRPAGRGGRGSARAARRRARRRPAPRPSPPAPGRAPAARGAGAPPRRGGPAPGRRRAARPGSRRRVDCLDSECTASRPVWSSPATAGCSSDRGSTSQPSVT